MNAAVDFHDSTLTAIERRGDILVLVLAPAHVHKPGTDPNGPGTGWLETVHMSVTGAEVHGDLSNAPQELWEGSLQCGESAYPGLAPVPLEFTGSVSLQLTAQSGCTLTVVGQAISITIVGTGTLLEDLPWPVQDSGPGPS